MAGTHETSEAPVAPVFGSIVKGEVVTIAIGSKKELYRIHKELICYHSEYFRTAYNGRWKESIDGVVLEDVEVEVFNIFVHWLYTQELPREKESFLRIAEANIDSLPVVDSIRTRSLQLLILKSSAFGDRFLAQRFRRLTHNMYVDSHFETKSIGLCSYGAIIWAYENLAADNPILSLMVDVQCLVWRANQDRQGDVLLLPHLPHLFLLKVMLKHGTLSSELKYCRDSSEKIAKDAIKTCSYHIHGSPEEKAACVWQSTFRD